jgi:hypothetical protein
LRHGAPVAAHWLGDRQMGPSILRYGTLEQKRKFLPGLIVLPTVSQKMDMRSARAQNLLKEIVL